MTPEPVRVQLWAPRVTRDGRSLISLGELAWLSGASHEQVAAMCARRVKNGHPAPVIAAPKSGALFFDEESVLRWYHRYGYQRTDRAC